MRILILILALASAAPQEPTPCGGNWPQWRGPRRDNVSDDKGLLRSWPEAGPPLFWEVHGVGGGIAAVAVAGGRVFTVGYLGDSEYLTALDESTGRRLWAARIGPLVQENSLMRWLGQRTPTVDGQRVYAFHTNGLLVCFLTSTGKELWRKDYAKDFGAVRPGWGFCDRPLVDGDRLICTPGGKVASVVALHKVTGATMWTSNVTGGPAHSATVISEAGGVRQYVTCLAWRVVGINASNGKQLWTHEDFGRTGSSCTAIPLKDAVLVSAGYGVGAALLKLTGPDPKVEKQYATQKLDISPFQDSGLVVGDHFYAVGGNGRSCVEVASGQVLWTDRSIGRGLSSMTHADGQFYIHHSDGTVALGDATPEKFVGRSSFRVPGWQQATGASNPVVTGGRMYIRNETRLMCYDVRESALKAERTRPPVLMLDAPGGKAGPLPPAEAIFVPTPQDVVEKMLQVAAVGETDTLYDLGSGDGRIVLTAAKKHKATAVGFEIDEKLVKESRAAIEKAGLQDLASIESKDMFTVELDRANVVAVYLPEKFLERLMPQFDKMGCGARIVSHQFKIPGVELGAVHRMESKDDGDLHAIYVYVTPLTRKKD